MSRRDASNSTTVIVLAAGAGSRYRDVGHKLTAELPKAGDRPRERVATRAIAAAQASSIGPVVVITGRLDARELGLDDQPDVTAVHNPKWAEGQMTSVRAGIEAAASNGSECAVIGLADQPGIAPTAWRNVADAVTSSTPIAVATYAGTRANPVALRRETWDLLDSSGDEGARALMRLRPDLVVEVPCSGSPNDIDTVEDLAKWQNN